MEGVMMPRESARLIYETSTDVNVCDKGVQKVAELVYEKVKSDSFNIQSWRKDHELNPQKMDKEALDWVFLADTLNFSFWSDDETKKFMVKYKGKEYTGYWSWCAAINRALDEGIPITDPKYFASISKEKLAEILKSDSDYDIPMLEERLEVLQEAGKVLVQKYNSSFATCIEQCKKSAQSLLKLVVNDFSSYRDIAEYNGKKVSFYKRAQILIADIWSCFEGKSYGEFVDIETITMFADYRIPQALVYFEAMTYSNELMDYLKKDKMMKTGDRYEVEIRGCSIWATEMICKQTRQRLEEDEETKDKIINSIMVDHFLWDYRRDHNDKMPHVPYHKIRCIYY